tara:strand:- start:233 stop:658 length:426 start_codon:yes stop_codon:yes gene_type:complete
METLQNKEIVLKDTEIITVDILSQYPSGKFRFITRTKLGMTCSDARDFDNPRLSAHPESIISGYKKGALQTVQFCPEGSDFYLTVFSRTGKKVKLIDESILADLTVGTINSMYYNTNLYSNDQYRSVNSKTWASKAFVLNS